MIGWFSPANQNTQLFKKKLGIRPTINSVTGFPETIRRLQFSFFSSSVKFLGKSTACQRARGRALWQAYDSYDKVISLQNRFTKFPACQAAKAAKSPMMKHEIQTV